MIRPMRDILSAPLRRAASEKEWWVPLALATGGVVLVLICWTIILSAQHTAGWGFDFRAYYDAAIRYVATGSPYQPTTMLSHYRPGPAGLYLYTPVLALLVVPLTWLGPAAATLTWLFIRLGLLALTCALMPVPRWVKVATLAVAVVSAEFLYDLNLGNVSLIVTFFAVVCWRWLDKPISGVAVAASVMIRPAMGLIGVWWLVRRRWQPISWAVMGGAAIIVATLPFVGVTPWFQYLRVLRNVTDVMGVDHNLDFGSTALALGFSSGVANIVLVGGYVLAVVAIVASLRRDREISFVVTLMASLLLSPLLWDHYLTSLIVPAALLAARGRRFAVLLPLMGWLPVLLLPIVAAAAMFLPFVVSDRGEAALRVGADEPQPIADADASLSGAAGA